MASSHGGSHRSDHPGSESLPKTQHKKDVIPLRRSARLQQLSSVQSQRKPDQFKSSLPLSTFHLNNIARIYRRSKHKHFPFLVQELEDQQQKLSDTGKTLEDSDGDQSTYSTPTASADVSSVDFQSEASEDTLSAPSDTELFGLRAKSPLNPTSSTSAPSASRPSSPIASVTSQAESSVWAPSPSLSTSYVPPSGTSSVTPSIYGRRRIKRTRRRKKHASPSSSSG